MNDFDYLAQLPGQEREQNWIRERLKTLSAREGIALSAAALGQPPENCVDAINQLQSLDWYEIRINAGSYEQLGEYYLRNFTKIPEDALPYVDLTQVGEQCEDKYPGLFVGNCYVQYPLDPPPPAYQGQGALLPNDDGWSVKLKLASPAAPDGVWLRLPGQNPYGDESSTEETLALQELRVQRWDECTLLEARCILPEAGNLMEQYSDVADLIYDGTSLGYILSEHGQGSRDFMARYAAALDLEGCQSLKLALDISQNMNCYDWVPRADLETSAAGLLLDAGLSEDLIHSGCIDLSAYKAHLLEKQGYTLTADESGYIARNSREFQYQFSTPAPEEAGMTMR